MLSYTEAVSDSSSADGGDNTRNLSPWTFENESLNPALQPSNAQLRTSTARRRRVPVKLMPGASSLPPYHPDYQEAEHNNYNEPEEASSSEDDDENIDPTTGQPRLRRGSEGFEILPENREEMLRRYLEELGEEPGRYIRYIPQVEDETDSDFEAEDDDTPLAYIASEKAKQGTNLL